MHTCTHTHTLMRAHTHTHTWWPGCGAQDMMKKVNQEFSADLKQEVEEFYFSHYCFHFSQVCGGGWGGASRTAWNRRWVSASRCTASYDAHPRTQ